MNGGASEPASRRRRHDHILIAYGAAAEDPERDQVDDCDEDAGGAVGGESVGVVGEDEAEGTVDDAGEDDDGAEVAVQLPGKGRGVVFGVVAVVEEAAEAEGGLHEEEEGGGEAEGLVRRVESGVFAVVDGIVDAEDAAGEDAEGGAALADEVGPEGEAEGEPGQERASGEEDDEADGHDEAVGDGDDLGSYGGSAVFYAGVGGWVGWHACFPGCALEVHCELAVSKVFLDFRLPAVGLQKRIAATNGIEHRLCSAQFADFASFARRNRPGTTASASGIDVVGLIVHVGPFQYIHSNCLRILRLCMEEADAWTDGDILTGLRFVRNEDQGVQHLRTKSKPHPRLVRWRRDME